MVVSHSYSLATQEYNYTTGVQVLNKQRWREYTHGKHTTQRYGVHVKSRSVCCCSRADSFADLDEDDNQLETNEVFAKICPRKNFNVYGIAG